MSFLSVYIFSMILSLITLCGCVMIARSSGTRFDTDSLKGLSVLVICSFIPVLNVVLIALMAAVFLWCLAEYCELVDKILEWLNRGQ